MQKRGKKYTAAAKNRVVGTGYQARQALEIVKTNAFAKFDETVEVVVRLGVDPRHADHDRRRSQQDAPAVAALATHRISIPFRVLAAADGAAV